MFIEQLTLRHFRNYQETTVAFAPEGAYITGANGSGKTNLLEAIYFLANQVSFRTANRDELQGWNATRCMVGAVMTQQSTQRQSELAVHLSGSGRRLWINGKETKDRRKFAAHFAAVAFHPGTLNVIKGGPAGRRYLVDRGIASLQPMFGQMSQDFQRILKQRNALLRTPADPATLPVWTERFIEMAIHLTRARLQHVLLLNQTLTELVQELATEVGSLTLDYQPAVLAKCTPHEREAFLAEEITDEMWQQRFMAESQRLQRAEEAMGQTLFGPQRDDVKIHYQGRESRSYASQGQQRLAAFLVIAAVAIAIYRHCGYRPVVLLDDVISELDEHNRRIIFDFLKTHAFQVFITDVEERQAHRSSLTCLRVRQTHGYAELQGDAMLSHSTCNI